MNGGFCLAGGSDGRGRFTPLPFIISLVPSTTGRSEQPSFKPRQLLLQWKAANPQELFAIDTWIQAHHRAVPISSPNSSPRPSKSAPARLLLTNCFPSGLSWHAGLPTPWHLPSMLRCHGNEASTLPCTGKETTVKCALRILRHSGTPRGTQGTSWVHLHPTSCTSWDSGTRGNSFQLQILKDLILL